MICEKKIIIEIYDFGISIILALKLNKKVSIIWRDIGSLSCRKPFVGGVQLLVRNDSLYKFLLDPWIFVTPLSSSSLGFSLYLISSIA